MSEQKKWVKVSVYEIHTPKLDIQNDKYLEKRFDREHFIGFFNKIMSLPLENRIFDQNNKFLTLEGFSSSDDAEFYEGFFTSARYGETSQLVHRRTFDKRPSDKTIDEGDENTVYFVIDVTNGRFYLQSDSKRIVTKVTIDKYLRNYIDIYKDEIDEFNRTSNLTITPKNLFNFKTVYSKDFFDEINKLLRVKKATMKVNYSQDTNSEVVNAIRRETEELDGADEITYTLANKERGGGMRRVQKFLKNLEEIDKYENIILEGIEQSGRNKAIKLEDHPQTFSVKVNVNANGIINFQNLTDGIIQEAKNSR
ncbi:hypothetical protein MOF28_20100 [Bacillus haynesii]|uniref:hypothetical protein n=1 Tax=Bacillus haynesii TaxID=1925021 RepID=UPI00227F90CC|nr:hypothetical protein [Bacillus haynesii]MCY9340633.1 hypothetical protein [Bacillus haynesii]